jgi:hypothetical protein
MTGIEQRVCAVMVFCGILLLYLIADCFFERDGMKTVFKFVVVLFVMAGIKETIAPICRLAEGTLHYELVTRADGSTQWELKP